MSGVGNSGKSSAIRLYLEMERVFHLRRGDVTIVFPLRRKKLLMGVASGGDNTDIINRNFRFFDSHPCDVIVCTSKRLGSTPARVRELARQRGARLIIIPTTKVPANRRQQTNAAIAGQIFQAV
jgi:hypothetical protein